MIRAYLKALMTSHSDDTSALEVTPLHALHVELGAKMVPFAGYDMPVQYKDGVLTEHLHTRAAAGLFDVSHMGQVVLHPRGADPALELERLVPGDICGLEPGQQRYSLLLNELGRVIDDIMVTRTSYHDDGRLYVVLNAACKSTDISHLEEKLHPGVLVQHLFDQALLALQGPKAVEVLASLVPDVSALGFMCSGSFRIDGRLCHISRSGYTGEDGFELSMDRDDAEPIARLLLSHNSVKPIGLGARDSLRLEAGLCLYGHDIDETTTPIEGALAWTIGKRRRAEANFPGARIIMEQIASGVARKRVGILPEGKAPAREHTEIVDASGKVIGEITSGGYGPTVGGPIAMGYVETAFARVGTEVELMVRGKGRPARIVAMPFVEKRFHRPAAK